MNLIRRTATTLGAIFLAALLLAALAPKATRGIAAALVQVTNTSANPVPVTANTASPFTGNLCLEVLEPGICQPNSNFILVPSTNAAGAPVNWLVIQQVSGLCTSDSSTSVIITPHVTFGVSGNNTAQGFVQPFFYFNAIPSAGGGNPGSVAAVDSHVRIYVPAGDFLNGAVDARPNSSGAFCSLSFNGHLE
jgi:hypothetical protein